MVFFNDPVPVDEHELQAIRLALAAQARFAVLADAWRKRGIDLSLGIQVEAGYATLGRIGFEGRFDYGALGPVVNLASRLGANASEGQILIGQRVFAATEHAVETTPVGAFDLKGFARPVVAYEVRGSELRAASVRGGSPAGATRAQASQRASAGATGRAGRRG